MDSSPTREYSHFTCHNIIPAIEADIKQYKTCVDCCMQDATIRKRKWHKAKASAAQQATAPNSKGVSVEAFAYIFTENDSNGQKQQRTTDPIIISEDSNDRHIDVSIIYTTAQKTFTYHCSHHQ
jgi:hypothetical protein